MYIKTYIFDHFYQQYLVLLTMVPRNMTTRGANKVCWTPGATEIPDIMQVKPHPQSRGLANTRYTAELVYSLHVHV